MFSVSNVLMGLTVSFQRISASLLEADAIGNSISYFFNSTLSLAFFFLIKSFLPFLTLKFLYFWFFFQDFTLNSCYLCNERLIEFVDKRTQFIFSYYHQKVQSFSFHTFNYLRIYFLGPQNIVLYKLDCVPVSLRSAALLLLLWIVWRRPKKLCRR